MWSEENITIAIPVYERYEFFEDAVNSAINQTMPCKIIIVDNASSHNKFHEYVKKKNLKRLTYYKNNKNVGAIENWNKCIENAQTSWVSILHSDDMLSLYYIEYVCNLILKYPNENVFLVSDETAAEPNKILLEPGIIKFKERLKANSFLIGNYAGFPGNIFNKTKFAIRFKDLKGASDYEFWYQMAKIKPLKHCANVLAFYRSSENQDSATMNIEEVVIKPTYLVRKDIIKFGGVIMKAISMYELFDLYRFYQRTYKRPEENSFQLSIPELNSYFVFFNKKGSRLILFPLFKLIKKVLKKIY